MSSTIAKYVPGFGAYLNLQTRRDDDLEVRKYLANRLQDCKRDLQAVLLPLVNDGKLDAIHRGEKLRAAIDLIQSKIRSTTEGYSSWFDKNQIDEAKLKQVVDLDNDLVAVVDRLQSEIAKLESSGLDFKSAMDVVTNLRDRFSRRSEILSK